MPRSSTKRLALAFRLYVHTPHFLARSKNYRQKSAKQKENSKSRFLHGIHGAKVATFKQ
jgi:hypothetical protein